MKKPSLAKGTRDFLPFQAKRRKYIFETIESVFVSYGYQPLETPAMENLETLTGKYGDEGDKLLFKILNSGDYLKDVTEDLLQEKNSNKLISEISEKGLRYDLTVPFARVVAMHQQQITFPFKRYQIQPVWRADRPQRGRYREFYQCDADVVGSNALLYEAELLQIYDKVFGLLNIPVKILINHRKILEGIAVEAGCSEQFVSMTVELDKLDKVGEEEVKKGLCKLNISELKAQWILDIIKSPNIESFSFNEMASAGVLELKKAFSFNNDYTFSNELQFSASLARGLSYYTGCIFEVIPQSFNMGSLGGGGRYDNLTGVFGLPGVSGVGISFGADRIYDVMDELNLFPMKLNQPIRALFISLDDASLEMSFAIATKLRDLGISVDVYPEALKIKKQFAYAESLSIPFVIILGEEERKQGIVNIKNQQNGDQNRVKFEEIGTFIC
ncbi:MAG: histidine--tRNA ligase [Saprospiraceae bacterium]|nr:histidine--tRNA ligase [Saprospiraceae bacterium]MBK9727349.1 histidine--tRNA ligase [Saprospiraceae bacterium]